MGGRCFAVLCVVLASLGGVAADAAAVAVQELRRGFSAAHDGSNSQFEPVLSDPAGVFALGFLRVNATMLDLAVLHLPSSFPLWRAIPDRPAQWFARASLSFDGDLVLTDRAANKVLWSAGAAGDRVVLLSTSNLQIQSGSSPGVVWQSFDRPSETIVQGQNLTSAAALYTSDRRFAMRLGTNYFGLYIEPPPSSSGGVAVAMYWKHTALEAKAQIVAGGGPTCWGSVYNNGTGYCYFMDYPAQMMVAADERKVGYFKVRSLEEAGSGGGGGGRVAGVKVALLAVGVTVLAAAAAFGAYRVWKKRCRAAADASRQGGGDDDGLSPGPYKNLGSFSSVELSSSFRG
uniref:non-specific serine/threonine protein kinase n=1 Tax=Oryza brachyantha TaxID=4533 RepID=J3LDE6_ORYBR